MVAWGLTQNSQAEPRDLKSALTLGAWRENWGCIPRAQAPSGLEGKGWESVLCRSVNPTAADLCLDLRSAAFLSDSFPQLENQALLPNTVRTE